MISFWNDKNNFLGLHFIRLSSRYTLLHRTEILVFFAKSIRFVKDLTPSVFAGSLCSQCTKLLNCERHIMIHSIPPLSRAAQIGMMLYK